MQVQTPRAAAKSTIPSPDGGKNKYDEGTNFVEAGIEANPYFFALIIAAPFLSLLLAYLTSPAMEKDHSGMATSVLSMLKALWTNPWGSLEAVWHAGRSVVPTLDGVKV